MSQSLEALEADERSDDAWTWIYADSDISCMWNCALYIHHLVRGR